MRYYNEAKTERAIRRQASWITFLIFAFIVSATVIVLSDQPEQYLPEFVKEWLELVPEASETPKKRA